MSDRQTCDASVRSIDPARTEGSLASSPRRRRSKAMARETETGEIEMERAAIVGTSFEVSRVALGTWAIGGWMWGGTEEAESIATIRAAVEHGINLIDTARSMDSAVLKKSSARPSPRVISAR